MKNIFSLKKSVAALSLLMTCGLSAQEMTFEKVMSSLGDSPTLPFTHRTRPAVGDYNNDDFLDIVMGGQNFKNDYEEGANFNTGGWNCAAILVKNNGDGTFTVSAKSKNEEGTDENPDTPGCVVEDLANLPISTFSFFRFLDFNNDGNLDLIVRGKGEHNFNVGEYLLLLENLGPEQNYKFKIVENHGINQALNEDYLQGIAIGDYDRDGFVDILITGCENKDNSNNPDDENYDPERLKRRFVELYKNNGGDGTFTIQKIATTQGEEIDGNFKPMSHSDVAFADLNNDGWLDIVYTGYSDNKEGDPRESGKDIRIYQNIDEGTAFLDVTPLGDPSFMGGSEVTLFVEDLNADGLLDIILMGDGAPTPYGSTIYLNSGDFNFTILDNETSGFLPVRAGTSGNYADMNHDGRLDAAVMGYSNAEGGLFGGVLIQGENDTFTYQNDLFITGEAKKSGGLVIADLFNHGKLDAFQVEGEWKGEVAMFKNTSNFVNQVPTAPTNVVTNIKDGVLTVTWDDATDDVTPASALFYNVYVKNNKTGKISMIIPANPETGRLKVVTDYQTGIRSSLNTYSMFVDDSGDYDYTIGVQAIDQAQGGSLFATSSQSTGMQQNTLSNVNIKSVADGFIVNSANDQDVEVTDMLGRVIKKDKTNKLISVPSNGIYLITTGGRTYKVGK